MISAKETYLRIDQWMSGVERDEDWDRELHIDAVHESVADPRTWMAAAVKFFSVATDVRDRRGRALFIELSFDLEGGDEPRGSMLESLDDVRAELTQVPPALFCYPREIARDILREAHACPIEGLRLPRSRTFFIERRREIEGDYQRSILVVSPPDRAAPRI